jgi:hypothetical protein
MNKAYNLTQPEPKSKYDFDPDRCKKAIESLAKMVHDNGYTAIPTRDKVLLKVILDDLVLDIEALHTRAQERDQLLDSLKTTPVYESNNGEFVPSDCFYEAWDWVDDKRPTPDLNL